MQIDLTKEQYRHMLDMLCLGEWTANGVRLYEDRLTCYDDMLRTFCAHAEAFGFGDLVSYDAEAAAYYPNDAYEQEMRPIVDQYNNAVFWQELVNRMAAKEALQAGYGFLSEEAYTRAKSQAELAYEQEFKQNGLRHVQVAKPKND
ncbi:hypothetical protein [Sporosarcina trichiuri]|uniref:hypothetical protein n=1 Tax=Sporosarcina trichiuri TaxID=3056445 RepID=UPI0025B4153A|nr:hypothetical protein [Sporosarcina sp. 0.2-SM1T-5]WJY26332.1 hypothetical protein QWT68_09565 [Sporosarcina sp. 0.2-SM1T-5]